MATDLLCSSPRCKPPTRHKPDCVGDPQEPCRGCLPARAADGLRLCQWETDRLGQQPLEAATLHAELGLALVGSGSGDGIGQKNPGRGLNLNPKVVEHRATIRHVLAAIALRIAEERGFTLPADNVRAVAGFVAASSQWLAAHEEAGQFAVELAELVEVGRSLRQPSQTRIIEIGPCPQKLAIEPDEDDVDGEVMHISCAGVVRALLRTEASLLPSAIQCDADDEHAWDSTQWSKLGRQMQQAKTERKIAV
jgi:hypothetical protein